MNRWEGEKGGTGQHHQGGHVGMWGESGAFSEKVCYFWYHKLVILEAPQSFIITVMLCGAQLPSLLFRVGLRSGSESNLKRKYSVNKAIS